MKSQLLTSVSIVRQEMLELDAEVATLEASIAEQTAALARTTALMDAKVDTLRELRSILSRCYPSRMSCLESFLNVFAIWRPPHGGSSPRRPSLQALAGRGSRHCLAYGKTSESRAYGWVCKDAEGLLRRTISSSGSRQLHLTVGSRPSSPLPFKGPGWRQADRQPDGSLSVFPKYGGPQVESPAPQSHSPRRRVALCGTFHPIRRCCPTPGIALRARLSQRRRHAWSALAWFASAPCLERLSLHLSFDVPLLSSSPLPWPRSESWTFNFPSLFFDAMSVLRQTPKLQECSIGSPFARRTRVASPPAFTLPGAVSP
ncbi:hypothetical protein C8R43DRAFT_1143571 [Mycena crocata]|nr:hypothetical protein C8R43DRAFT_1143571 [Mycena crocata]